jgi:hypothetical protein
MSNNIEKYKLELNTIKKIVNNNYIYKIWYKYGFTIGKKFVPLYSNISIYEACFISLLIKIYMNNTTKKKLNILEIGLAYGTSSLILMNQALNFKYKTNYDIIDPNQTTYWENIGIINIENFLNYVKKKNKINKINLNYKLYEESSVTKMPKLRKKYDIIFIDGAHSEEIVIQDLMNSDKHLVNNGLMIIDDVLHKGVKDAVLQFIKKYKNYKRISVNENRTEFFDEKILYDINAKKRSFINPNTMFCLQKIKTL